MRTLQCPNLRVSVYTQVACLSSAALRKALYEWKWKYRSNSGAPLPGLGLGQCLSSLCKAHASVRGQSGEHALKSRRRGLTNSSALNTGRCP